MRVADVRKKYPEFFAEVEAAVWDDTADVRKKYFVPAKSRCPYGFRLCWRLCKRIAYNAAAVATLELHKVIVAGRKKTK